MRGRNSGECVSTKVRIRSYVASSSVIDLVDLDAQVVAHHLEREVDLLVDQRRRLDGLLLGGGVDGRPLLLEQVEVALQLLALRAAGRGADDQPAAALRRQLLTRSRSRSRSPSGRRFETP